VKTDIDHQNITFGGSKNKNPKEINRFLTTLKSNSTVPNTP
jgi:hypothetical protein